MACQLTTDHSWLNEQVLRLVWREGMAAPNLPQIVLVERHVDVTPYPRHLATHRVLDSILSLGDEAGVPRGGPSPLRLETGDRLWRS